MQEDKSHKECVENLQLNQWIHLDLMHYLMGKEEEIQHLCTVLEWVIKNKNLFFLVLGPKKGFFNIKISPD